MAGASGSAGNNGVQAFGGYFFVRDPVRYDISGVASMAASLPADPERPDASRDYVLEDPCTVFVSGADSRRLSEAGRVSLTGLCSVKYSLPAIHAGDADDGEQTAWVSRDSVPAVLEMPDGTVARGLAEGALAEVRGGTALIWGYGRAEAVRSGPEGLRLSLIP